MLNWHTACGHSSSGRRTDIFRLRGPGCGPAAGRRFAPVHEPAAAGRPARGRLGFASHHGRESQADGQHTLPPFRACRFPPTTGGMKPCMAWLSGNVTVFPQVIGLGATFDAPLIKQMSTVISTEARARYNQSLQQQQPPAAGGAARPQRRAGFLGAQHQHLPRPALGTRPGNLRRGPVPHRAHGRGIRPGHAGRRSEVFQDHLHPQALRRAQRSRTHPPLRGREASPCTTKRTPTCRRSAPPWWTPRRIP